MLRCQIIQIWTQKICINLHKFGKKMESHLVFFGDDETVKRTVHFPKIRIGQQQLCVSRDRPSRHRSAIGWDCCQGRRLGATQSHPFPI